MLHCRNEDEDLYSIELQINLTHFSFAFLLVPDATFFLHQFLFSSSSYQTSWTVFDTNCLYTPTCPVSPPPHQSCTVTPSLCCLRGKAVCLWLLLGQIADHLSLCSSQNNTYYSSLITVGQMGVTGTDKSEDFRIPTIAVTACVKYGINLYYLVKSCQILK